MRPSLLTALSVWMVVGMAVAGDVHVVDGTGAGDFLTPQKAIDAAQEGDVILVREGRYPRFSVTGKAVSIVAEAGASPKMLKGTGTGVCWIDHSMASSVFLVSGIDAHLRFHYMDGVVLVSGATTPVPNEPLYSGVYAYDCEWVLVSGCRFLGGDGYDTTGGGPACNGGSGVEAHYSTNVAVYDCQIQGGDGGYGSSGLSCGYGGAGGSGVFLAGSSFGFTQRLLAIPGLGGGGDCGDGPDGLVVAIDSSSAHARSPHDEFVLKAPRVLREKKSGAIVIRGHPGVRVSLGVSHGLDPRFVGAGAGVFALRSPVQLIDMGTIPPSGVLVRPYTASDLPASEEGGVLYLQAVGNVPASKIRYLSNPEALVVLDASL